jgi:4'-phosphopantetheinyl transferase
MPLEKLHQTTDTAWALWKINEDEPTLAKMLSPFEAVPSYLSNPFKRLEFLAARVLIKALLKEWNLTFNGLTKDEFGKPFLKDLPHQISLSHSYPYVAVITDNKRNVGIDLEQPKEKLLKIAPRVLEKRELKDAGDNIVKHCVYWCAKESLVKIHGKKDLVFAENLKIKPFSLEKQGDLIGRIIVDNKETAIPLQYFIYENFVVVLNK